MATTVPSQISFKEILVASDFSDASQNTVNHAKAIAKRFGSHIVLAHVSDPVTPISIPESEWIAEDPRHVEEQVEAAGVTLRAEGFSADAVNTYGRVKDEILALAEAHHADLIVLGSHARSGLNRLLFGSEAESILRHASRPVMAIGPACSQAPEEWTPKTILCASSLGPREAMVLAYSYRLAQSTGATFKWLSIDDIDQPSNDEQRWRAFEEAITPVLPAEEIGTHQIRCHLSGNSVAANIVAATRELKPDLIVMGARAGRFGADHLLAGILMQVLVGVPCPLLTMHLN